ncbi:hypothetical protein [Serratia marcescens]|uniref:hypothetical protein n=1 Tax=Serratia marcescens TaxID=615 RepID=UPI001BD256E1
MTDKTASVSPENTTSALSHLAFCDLAALGLVRQDGIAGTPYAENLFLNRHCCKNLQVINLSSSFADGAAHEPIQRPAFSA